MREERGQSKCGDREKLVQRGGTGMPGVLLPRTHLAHLVAVAAIARTLKADQLNTLTYTGPDALKYYSGCQGPDALDVKAKVYSSV